MQYENIREAKFLSRPNRFIAWVDIDGRTELCHVKNTGRCRELLIPGARIFIQEKNGPTRKTKYDLISVFKGDRLINMDSQAPNRIFEEWVQGSGLFHDLTKVRPECKHGSSRFDFYIEADGERAFVEVKGVTLEENGVALFPDAPTIRGVKHLRELIICVSEGFRGYAVFIVQMRGVKHFTPNTRTHPEFTEALIAAQKNGVTLLALDCDVTKTGIIAKKPVDIIL